MRKGLPVVDKPGNYESTITGNTITRSRDASSHGMNAVPSMIAKAFPTGKVMADTPTVLKCNHCKRPVLKHAMPAHIARCLDKKQEKQRRKKEAKDARHAAARREKTSQNGGDGSDDDNDDLGSKTAGKTGDLAGSAGKKRKALDEGADDGSRKKKTKKEAANSKQPRLKAPVDVEKQCGVELPMGGQCARSLTCKSHSMGAKRAVPGRSAPYDKLLNEYQRKNQAKLQKAAFDANAPNPDDEGNEGGPVDSEEEKDAVIAAIGRAWGGQPLYQAQRAPLGRKYEYNRIKGMLSSALGGKSGGGLFGSVGGAGGGFFGAAVPAPPPGDETVVVHARKGSVIPGARSMMAPAATRKPSIVA